MVLTIKDLYYHYHKEVILEKINLEVQEGDFLAIIGPNGGGKSTLLKLITALLSPTKGSITLQTKPMGYVPQNTNININFPIKVIEVVMLGHSKRKIFGYAQSDMERAMEALKKVNMHAYAQSKIGNLSGGQRQRVMIARALFNTPRLLILDEPTSSIDVKGQKDIYNLLKELNQEITIIVVSHDISIILEYASKVAYINKRLSFHDISTKERNFNAENRHFCEVELLEMLES